MLRSEAKRLATVRRADRVDPIDGAFPRQREVLADPSRFKALICGRAAGKSDLILRDLVHGLEAHPNRASLYAAQTRPSAKNILWKPLKAANHKFGWGLKLNETELRATHPNGSWLQLVGTETVRDLEKARGVPWYRVRIDECGAIRPSSLAYFVESVIEPRLIDYPDSSLWLAGTCTVAAHGYFYDCTTGTKPRYSVHRWTARENPHLDWQRFIHDPVEGVLSSRKWDEANPIFKREYLAEWTVDGSLVVYRFDRSRNVLRELPKLPSRVQWRYALGIDFGFGNATAYALVAWAERGSLDTYVVESAKKHGLAPSQAADWLRGVIETHDPDVIVADVGGLGKGYAEEFRVRHPGIEVQAAKKDKRRAAIEFTSDALFTGRLRSLECNADLHGQWAQLLWNEQRDNVADGQDDDLADAAMYAFRESPAYGANLDDGREPDTRSLAEREDDEDYEQPETPYWNEVDV